MRLQSCGLFKFPVPKLLSLAVLQLLTFTVLKLLFTSCCSIIHNLLNHFYWQIWKQPNYSSCEQFSIVKMSCGNPQEGNLKSEQVRKCKIRTLKENLRYSKNNFQKCLLRTLFGNFIIKSFHSVSTWYFKVVQTTIYCGLLLKLLLYLFKLFLWKSTFRWLADLPPNYFKLKNILFSKSCTVSGSKYCSEAGGSGFT